MQATPEISSSTSFHPALDVAHQQLKELGNQSQRRDALPVKNTQ
jgi:hypothetical protein